MKLSIRFKILLGFAVIVFLSFSIQTFGFILTDQYIRQRISKSLLEKTQNAGDQIQNFLAKVELDHLGISQEFLRNNEDITKTLPIIEYTLRQNRFITKIIVLSPTGRILTRVDKYGPIGNKNPDFEILSDPFNTALKGSRSISKIYTVNEGGTNHSQVDFYTPITSSQGAVIGVIESQLRMDQVWELLSQITVGKTGFTYVVDDEGRLVAHPNSSLVLSGVNFSKRENIANLIANTPKYDGLYTEYVNEKNILSVSNAIKLQGINWIVLAEQSQTEALSEIRIVRNLFFGTFVGSLFLLIVLSVIISESITRPIRDMTKVTRLIEKGNLDARVFVNSADEIQDLGNSFNSMARELKEKLLELQEKVALLQTQKISLNHSTELLQKSEINLREINARLENEREIIAGEKNKLSVILSGIKDAVIAVDLNGTIILFNDSACNLLGYSLSEVIGKNISNFLKLYRKETEVSADIYCPIRQDSYEGVVFHENMLKLVGKNNKEAYINIVTGKIKDSQRDNLGCILTLHDISSERELEEMKLDFVSMAAHELRTPLTAIQGYLSVFIDENPDILQGERGDLIKHVQTSSHQLMGLVENLLSVSRIERNAFTVSSSSLDWVGLVDEVIMDFIYRAKEKNISLSFVRPNTKISEVVADKIRIREVLSNLISNAISYTPSGGKILITIDEDKNFVTTHIKDSGVGIPQTALSRLFTKFYRVSNSLSQGSKGTGLGLYISKAIVEMHKGKIWVESEVNKGSTFSFSLPKKTDIDN